MFNNYYKVKCNEDGNGYRIKFGVVTAFVERRLFLRSSSNHETEIKTHHIVNAEPAQSPEAESSPSTSSGIKRKVDSKAEGGDSTKETEVRLKRIKNESNDANNSAQDEVETTAEESLFSNELLLRTIFANLDVKDLKSCREVNCLWNLEATKILLKRDSLSAIQISNGTVQLLDAAVYKPSIPLQDFRNLIANSNLFPSTSFALKDDPLSQNMIDFFREHGHLVKSFCVEPEDEFSDKSDAATGDEILLLAAMQFPNLRTLKLLRSGDRLYPISPVIIMALDNYPDMENLQTLEFPTFFPTDVIARIINKASNLENIYFNYEEDYFMENGIEKLVKLGNVIPRLKNIHLSFSSSSLKIYEQVLEQSPRLVSIAAIDLERYERVDVVDVGRFLTKLFCQCSESLTEILGVRCLNEIPGLRLPVFPEVRRLEIVSHSLPSGVDLQQVFPNLRKVEIECWYEYEPQQVSPKSISPSFPVRHLQVKMRKLQFNEEERYIPGKWIQTICSLFPNVTSAKFCNPLSESGYRFIWKLSKLQELHLEIETDTNPGTKWFTLDSAFTGFSYSTVKKLYKKYSAGLGVSSEEVQSLRITNSIVDLKEIRTLSLRLFNATIKKRDDNQWSTEGNFEKRNVNVIFDPGNGKDLLQVKDIVVLSYITKCFGFDLCPRLESNVSVGFTHCTKLLTMPAEIDPYDSDY